MAITKTSATLAPQQLAVGSPIFAEDAQAVAEMLNYAVAENPPVYLSLCTSVAGWGDSGNEEATHGVQFNSGDTLEDLYDGELWIDPDVQQITCGASCTFSASTGEVHFTIGGDSDFTSHNVGNSGTEQTVTLDVSLIGTGWQGFKVQLKSPGAAATNSLDFLRIEGATIAAGSLPAPNDP